MVLLNKHKLYIKYRSNDSQITCHRISPDNVDCTNKRYKKGGSSPIFTSSKYLPYSNQNALNSISAIVYNEWKLHHDFLCFIIKAFVLSLTMNAD